MASESQTSIWRILALGIPAAIIAVGLRIFVFGLFVVPSSSMAPSLLIGDYIIASKWDYGIRSADPFTTFVKSNFHIGDKQPQRGDVVVFKEPGDNPAILVKRLIGLPGDKIQMYRSDLYVNRQLVRRDKLAQPLSFPGDDEPSADIVDYVEYLPPRNIPHTIRLLRGLEDELNVNNTQEVTVPQDNYFFMGDNRDRSDDSRVADVGYVPEGNVMGRVETTFFSMSQDARIWEVSKWSWAVRWHRLWRHVV